MPLCKMSGRLQMKNTGARNKKGPENKQRPQSTWHPALSDFCKQDRRHHGQEAPSDCLPCFCQDGISA